MQEQGTREKKRKKFRFKIKCESLETLWIEKSNMLMSLPQLFNIKCPEAKFLQGMNLVEENSKVKMKFSCCNFN